MGLVVSHPSRKNKNAARMGHPESGGMGLVVSHPSRKNKNAARMGHPDFVASTQTFKF
jgi:hypothetical protein